MNTNLSIIKYKATNIELEEGYSVLSPVFPVQLTKTPENAVQLFILYSLAGNLGH